MCGEALREVKADMHMELEKQTGYRLSDLNHHYNGIISFLKQFSQIHHSDENQGKPQFSLGRTLHKLN